MLRLFSTQKKVILKEEQNKIIIKSISERKIIGNPFEFYVRYFLHKLFQNLLESNSIGFAAEKSLVMTK